MLLRCENLEPPALAAAQEAPHGIGCEAGPH